MNTKIAFILTMGAWLAGLDCAQAQTTFTQITNGAIVNDKGIWIYCVWGDFHNSGFLDLIAPNYALGTNGYYENTGGSFLKISQGDPVQDSDNHVGAWAADYDNDGNLDLIITAGGFLSASHNRLYHNNGDGAFSPVSGGDLSKSVGYFGPGAWADYDRDGFVDFLVVNHGSPASDGGPSLLYHNNGDGTFDEITTGPVVTTIVGAGFSAVWEDYDNDGFPDLLVVDHNGPVNFLYHNEQNGTFSRVLTNIVATDDWPQSASCAAWGDYDNDGLPDLFVTSAGISPNQLYHNEGGGVFTRATSGPKLVASPGGEFNGCAWGDYDNDGYLDLFVSSFTEKNALFHNNGDGTFTRILSSAPAQGGGPNVVCGAVSWVDYDNDGFLDLFVGVVTDSNESYLAPAKNLLYHNNGNSNAWLEVKLIGTLSNRSAIGAKVRAHATIGGKSFWQLREIGNGGGYNCQPLVAHFGLGDATNVDTLRIEWPSGLVQTLTNVPGRQILTVAEHQLGATNAPSFTSVSLAPNGAVNLSASGDAGLLYLFQGSTNLVNWAYLGVRSNATGAVQFTDLRATNYPSRFYRVSIP
jgi:hypothetical protein